jgi:curved DNA-binding protein CbpA
VNPYEALGLGYASGGPISEETVNKAFKAKAREYHPDRGGDPQKMAEASQARDILLNPDRKKRFDQLGSTASGSLTLEEQARLRLGSIFYRAMEASTDDTRPSELFAAIAGIVGQGLAKGHDDRAAFPARVKRAKRMLASVRCSSELRSLLEANIAHMELQLNEINSQLEVGNLMLKMLETIEFD